MAASCPAGVPSDRAAILYRHTPPGTSPPTLLLDQQRHTAPSTPPRAGDSLHAAGRLHRRRFGPAAGYGEAAEPDVLRKGCVVMIVRRGVQLSPTRVKVSTPLSSAHR
jgi:hypothetical protein